MYFQIGVGMLVLWGLAYTLIALAFNEQLMKWLADNELFFQPMTGRYLDYTRMEYINVEYKKDDRKQAIVIIGLMGAFVCFLIYPVVIGGIIGYWVWLEYIKEHPKWLKIKTILFE